MSTYSDLHWTGLVRLLIAGQPQSAQAVYMTAEQYAAAYDQSFQIAVRFFVSRGLRYDDALETVQAGWAKGWEKRHQLREPAAVLPWIISVSKNLRYTALRHRRPILKTFVPSTERAALALIDAKQILERSRPEERDLLRAHYLQGFTVREMAEAADIPEQVLRSRLHRARRNALAHAKPRAIKRPLGPILPAA